MSRIAGLAAATGDKVRTHLKEALRDLGCAYEAAPFSSALRLPVAWRVQVHGLAPAGGWRTVPSAAAVGSPTCREVEGRTTYVGTGAPMDYQLGGERCRGGVVLAALGAVPSRQIINTARDHGALAALLFHPRASSVRAVAPDGHLPLPAATIGRETANLLARTDRKVRLDVASEDRRLAFENILVRRGEGPLHIVVVGHYDSRPLRLGPGGRSLSLGVMLSLLATLDPPADRRFTFAFLDGEEVGSVGSARYHEEVRRDAVEPPDLVVDLNALGTRRELGMEVRHPHGDGSRLQEFGLRAFDAAGLRLASRELDRISYGGTILPGVGWPVVALGGRPPHGVPAWDAGQHMPDRWSMSLLIRPIASLLCEVSP
jgi:hypothetical protein